jgi:hypothetical protein
MKARTCDFCGAVFKENDPNSDVMLYEITITDADDYTSESKEEKALRFCAADTCSPCATVVREELVHLQLKLTEARKARS